MGTGPATNLTRWGGLILVMPLVSGVLDGPALTMLAFVPITCFEAIASLPPAFKSIGATRTAATRPLAILDQLLPVIDSGIRHRCRGSIR